MDKDIYKHELLFFSGIFANTGWKRGNKCFLGPAYFTLNAAKGWAFLSAQLMCPATLECLWSKKMMPTINYLNSSYHVAVKAIVGILSGYNTCAKHIYV